MLSRYEKLFKFLYFGTPHEMYRKKILTSFSPSFKPWNDCYFSFPFELCKPTSKVLDVTQGLWCDRVCLKSSQLIYQALNILFSDFYRPISYMALYNKLYPNSFFNINSAPNQIRQIIHRLNHVLQKIGSVKIIQKNQKLYLKNDSQNGLCYLISHSSVHNPKSSILQKVQSLLLLDQRKGITSTTRKDFEHRHQLSERTANRYLNLAVKYNLMTTKIFNQLVVYNYNM